MIVTVGFNTAEDAFNLNVEMLHWSIKQGLPYAARFHTLNALMYARIAWPELL